MTKSFTPHNKESFGADWSIFHFEEIDSTSSWLKRNENELADKTVATAAFQSAGRGRLGRQWRAPIGSALMFSMLLRPQWPIDQGQGGWLTMISGLAAAEALSAVASVPVQLKWPNDIVYMLNDKLHKLGGILSEATIDHNRLAQAIIGIGININMTTDQLPQDANTPPCSLHTLTQQSFELDPILEAILNRFESYYQAAANGVSPLERWQNHLVTLGRPVTATRISGQDQSHKISGLATGVDEWGRLLIETADGALEPVAAGDVTLRNS